MAYYWVRSAKINLDQGQGAVEWAVRAAQAGSKAIGREVEVLLPTAGALDQILWVFRFETLADWEQAIERAEKDPAYQATQKEARDLHLVKEVQQQVYFIAAK